MNKCGLASRRIGIKQKPLKLVAETYWLRLQIQNCTSYLRHLIRNFEKVLKKEAIRKARTMFLETTKIGGQHFKAANFKGRNAPIYRHTLSTWLLAMHRSSGRFLWSRASNLFSVQWYIWLCPSFHGEFEIDGVVQTKRNGKKRVPVSEDQNQ